MATPPVNTGIQTAKYFNVAGLAVLIFDYFLTLEHEVRWTWNRGWTLARVVFVVSRYMPFPAAGMTAYAAIATTRNENCARFGQASNAIHIISIIAAEGSLSVHRRLGPKSTYVFFIGLLIIRTYAFWKGNKKFLAGLLIVAAVCIACAVSLTQVVGNLSAPASTSTTSSTNDNCIFQAGRNSAVQYGFLVAYELMLISLTVYKKRQDYRDSSSRMVKIVFQGGVRYMTAIIFVSLANIVILAAVPISYDEMMDVPQLVIHSVLASRVLFNLRRSDGEEMGGSTLMPLETFRPAYGQTHTY